MGPGAGYCGITGILSHHFLTPKNTSGSNNRNRESNAKTAHTVPVVAFPGSCWWRPTSAASDSMILHPWPVLWRVSFIGHDVLLERVLRNVNIGSGIGCLRGKHDLDRGRQTVCRRRLVISQAIVCIFTM